MTDVRLDYKKAAPDAFKAMLALETAVQRSGLEHALIELVKMRVSQINGCAYCLDMHWKDLAALGETAQRMYSLDAWRECPYYSARERAALAWTEAVTRVADGQVPDAVYAEAQGQLTPAELANLTLALATINAWNRLSIAARLVPGEYQAGS